MQNFASPLHSQLRATFIMATKSCLLAHFNGKLNEIYMLMPWGELHLEGHPR